MQLSFVDPTLYRQRNQPHYLKMLQQQYPDYLIVPEGGSSLLGLQGVAELRLGSTPEGPADGIYCATGSGGTLAGLAIAHPEIPVTGIAVVKDPGLAAKIQNFAPQQQNWQLLTEHSGLRYGQFDDATLQLCLALSQQNLPLEPVYTGKALNTLLLMLAENQIRPGQRLVFFHTGGLQGLDGLLHQQRISPEHHQQIRSAELRLWHQFSERLAEEVTLSATHA